MKRLLGILAAGVFLALAFIAPVSAQQVNNYCTQNTAPPYTWAPCSPVNTLPVSASVSASISGFPGATPTTGTPIAVTTGGVTGALPAGAVVVGFNVGTTNTAYCKLGASSTTSDTAIPPASWFAFTVGAATQLTCITSTSTTTVNMVGGSGLPTGAGGGGGGGGGGAVTVANGADTAEGTTTDAVAAVPTSGTAATTIALLKALTNVANSATPAGTNNIGKIDILGNAGATLDGPAGTAATQALTVQGVAGMTKLLVTPDSVALPANQSVNVAQFGGTSTSTGQVAVSVAPVTATNTALVTALRPDSPGIIALGQTTKSASVPVTIASDQYVDPCQSPNIAKSSVAINITSAATTSLVAVSGSTTVYVCGFSVTISEVITTPNTILFEYGTGAACTSPTVLTGLYGGGGVTAGDPIPVSYGGAGMTIFKSAASAGICALTAIGGSGSFQGVMTYVQQ